jgi:hypothetical protein
MVVMGGWAGGRAVHYRCIIGACGGNSGALEQAVEYAQVDREGGDRSRRSSLPVRARLCLRDGTDRGEQLHGGSRTGRILLGLGRPLAFDGVRVLDDADLGRRLDFATAALDHRCAQLLWSEGVRHRHLADGLPRVHTTLSSSHAVHVSMVPSCSKLRCTGDPSSVSKSFTVVFLSLHQTRIFFFCTAAT